MVVGCVRDSLPFNGRRLEGSLQVGMPLCQSSCFAFQILKLPQGNIQLLA
jgi:hypothetical protein